MSGAISFERAARFIKAVFIALRGDDLKANSLFVEPKRVVGRLKGVVATMVGEARGNIDEGESIRLRG